MPHSTFDARGQSPESWHARRTLFSLMLFILSTFWWRWKCIKIALYVFQLRVVREWAAAEQELRQSGHGEYLISFSPSSILLKQKLLPAHTIRARRISLNINLSHSRSTPLAQFMAAITRYLPRIKFTRRRSLLKMQPQASLGLELIFTPPPPAIGLVTREVCSTLTGPNCIACTCSSTVLLNETQSCSFVCFSLFLVCEWGAWKGAY